MSNCRNCGILLDNGDWYKVEDGVECSSCYEPEKFTSCRNCNIKILRKETEFYMRHDAYGIPTGVYCDNCYNHEQDGYKRGRYYDESYAGEKLEPGD